MLKKIVRFNFKTVTQRPKMILLLAFILTIIAGVLASNLSMELSWVALAPKGDPSVEEYQKIIENFPSLDNIVVIIEGEDTKKITEAAKDIEIEVGKLKEYVTSTTIGLDQDFILDYALLLSPKEESEMMIYMLSDQNFESIYNSFGLIINDLLENNSTENLNIKKSMIRNISELIGDIPEYKNNNSLIKSYRNILTGPTVITTEDGKMAMIMIQPSFDIMDINKLEIGVNSIEEVIKNIDNKYLTLKIGATGMHIVARDETVSIKSDSSLTTIISLILILLILYFAFKSISAPLLTFTPLVIGIIWAIGLTMILIGRLNMMTVFASAMLIGLGIDYSIHMYSSYTERRSKGFSKLVSLEHSISISGPGVLIGGLTTAAAFIALNVSSLEMLKELGSVMGLGIICTLISVFWVLPALILVRKEKEEKIKKIRGDYKWIGIVATKSIQNKKIVIFLLIVLTIFMGYKGKDLEFDLNMLNLEPEGLESIELMTHLIDEYDMSTDSFSVEVDSIDEVHRLQKAYEKIDGVKEVTSIATFVPRLEEQLNKMEELKNMKAMISMEMPRKEANIELLLIQTNSYLDLLNDSEKIETTLLKKEFDELKKSFYEFKLVLESKNKSNLDIFTNDFYDYGLILKEQILDLKILRVDDIPENYKKQFVSKDGTKFLISVYPDFEIWDNMNTKKGEKFFSDISKVNRSITGTPVFLKILFDSVGEELLMIAIILVVILFTILLFHFRSIRYTVLGFIPLVLTLIFTTGTMVLLDLKLNMLNFLSILLILGIGIDYGVHILHHYKEGEKNIRNLFSSVGRAILLTTLTTICGFGSLTFSSYRGIASLGQALVIGVSYAFIFTIIVLPLLLKNEE